MKNNRILTVALALIATPFTAFARGHSPTKDASSVSRQVISASAQDGDAAALKDVLAIQPAVPLGPLDLLAGYEEDMASVAQGFTDEVGRIATAVREKKITEDEGESLCKEAYEAAVMQFQVFSGLHDMLEEEVSQTPVPQRQASSGVPAGLSSRRL